MGATLLGGVGLRGFWYVADVDDKIVIFMLRVEPCHVLQQ